MTHTFKKGDRAIVGPEPTYGLGYRADGLTPGDVVTIVRAKADEDGDLCVSAGEDGAWAWVYPGHLTPIDPEATTQEDIAEVVASLRPGDRIDATFTECNRDLNVRDSEVYDRADGWLWLPAGIPVRSKSGLPTRSLTAITVTHRAKPPTLTVEELDAMPVGMAVVRDDSGTYWVKGVDCRWRTGRNKWGIPASSLALTSVRRIGEDA